MAKANTDLLPRVSRLLSFCLDAVLHYYNQGEQRTSRGMGELHYLDGLQADGYPL